MSRSFTVIAVLIIILLAGCTSATDRPSNNTTGTDTVSNTSSNSSKHASWMTKPFFDVKENTTNTIASMEKPVVVESFAVWCPTCTRQQKEVKRLQEDFDVQHTSLSLNTDPNEGPAKVATHARQNGFDWTYGVASPELLKALQDEFGPSIFVAPNVPKILICQNNSFKRLPDGVRTAETLADDIKQGC